MQIARAVKRVQQLQVLESGPSAFAKLDVKHRGYLNSEDVSQLQGFKFKDADKNSDGKLDATEFNAAWAIYSGTPKA